MSQSSQAMKTVDRSDFQQQVEQMLRQVTQDKVQLTIEEDGKPVAVVTPFDADERRRARKLFLEQLEEIQRRANVPADEADELAREAVEAVRKRSA